MLSPMVGQRSVEMRERGASRRTQSQRERFIRLDRRVAIDPDPHVVTLGAFKKNLICFKRRQALRFAAYISQRIREDVLIGHYPIECGEVAALEGFAPLNLDPPDFVFLRIYC